MARGIARPADCLDADVVLRRGTHAVESALGQVIAVADVELQRRRNAADAAVLRREVDAVALHQRRGRGRDDAAIRHQRNAPVPVERAAASRDRADTQIADGLRHVDIAHLGRSIQLTALHGHRHGPHRVTGQRAGKRTADITGSVQRYVLSGHQGRFAELNDRTVGGRNPGQRCHAAACVDHHVATGVVDVALEQHVGRRIDRNLACVVAAELDVDLVVGLQRLGRDGGLALGLRPVLVVVTCDTQRPPVALGPLLGFEPKLVGIVRRRNIGVQNVDRRCVLVQVSAVIKTVGVEQVWTILTDH